MLRQITRACVSYADRYIPDPYLYAIILTFIKVIAAVISTQSDPVHVIDAWYNGLGGILALALQMALILATGVALANAPSSRGCCRDWRAFRPSKRVPRSQCFSLLLSDRS
jgi:short-chain fatty acids transporter